MIKMYLNNIMDKFPHLSVASRHVIINKAYSRKEIKIKCCLLSSLQNEHYNN